MKSLLEDGEMLLSDGRRLVSAERLQAHGGTPADDASIIPIHKDFALWVLANRPGFPFLGNDFFRECGDIFSAHVSVTMSSPSWLLLRSLLGLVGTGHRESRHSF